MRGGRKKGGGKKLTAFFGHACRNLEKTMRSKNFNKIIRYNVNM